MTHLSALKAPHQARDAGELSVVHGLRLTSRELEILQLIADGLGNRQIAQELYVSEDTVKTHVRHVLNKLRVPSRAGAVAIALRAQLIR
jgi:DNA-binding NarL/FixJ family response regulator